METIETHKAVTIQYGMKSELPDGSVKVHPQETYTFIFGVDRQVPSLEKALEGVPVGKTLSLAVPPSEIYGEHDPALIREIPKKGLIKQRLKEGRFYRQMKMGDLISFRVLEIRPDSILADFNKPMAGIGVTVEVKVLALRDATGEEIEAALENQMKKMIGCG